jgi:predicted ester cyclase
MSPKDIGVTPAVELVRRSFETLNEGGDIDVLAELVTPDFIINIPELPEPMHGRDAWKQNASMMFGAFPDLHAEIDDIFGVKDIVGVRLTFSGTHQGDFLGIAATNRKVEFKSVEFYRVDGDLLAEEWVAPDIESLMAQISA